MKILLALVVGAGLISGCSLAPSDQVLKALAQDKNTLCMTFHAIYGMGNGSMTIYRTGERNVSVECKEGSMTVTVPPAAK